MNQQGVDLMWLTTVNSKSIFKKMNARFSELPEETHEYKSHACQKQNPEQNKNGAGRKKFPGIYQAIWRLFKKKFYRECFTEDFKIEKKWAVDGCQFKIY